MKVRRRYAEVSRRTNRAEHIGGWCGQRTFLSAKARGAHRESKAKRTNFVTRSNAFLPLIIETIFSADDRNICPEYLFKDWCWR
jgi:hypothetical protein